MIGQIQQMLGAIIMVLSTILICGVLLFTLNVLAAVLNNTAFNSTVTNVNNFVINFTGQLPTVGTLGGVGLLVAVFAGGYFLVAGNKKGGSLGG